MTAISRIAVGQSLTVNQLVDMEWRFGGEDIQWIVHCKALVWCVCGHDGHESSEFGHESSEFGHESSEFGHESSEFGHESSKFGHKSSEFVDHAPFL